MKEMIILNPDTGWRTVYRCPFCDNLLLRSAHNEDADNLVIKEYYGEQSAKEHGWHKTSDPEYCDHKHKFVWVCDMHFRG